MLWGFSSWKRFPNRSCSFNYLSLIYTIAHQNGFLQYSFGRMWQHRSPSVLFSSLPPLASERFTALLTRVFKIHGTQHGSCKGSWFIWQNPLGFCEHCRSLRALPREALGGSDGSEDDKRPRLLSPAEAARGCAEGKLLKAKSDWADSWLWHALWVTLSFRGSMRPREGGTHQNYSCQRPHYSQINIMCSTHFQNPNQRLIQLQCRESALREKLWSECKL